MKNMESAFMPENKKAEKGAYAIRLYVLEAEHLSSILPIHGDNA